MFKKGGGDVVGKRSLGVCLGWKLGFWLMRGLVGVGRCVVCGEWGGRGKEE